MGVSSSNTTAQSARAGDSQIKAQGQTKGSYGNDPFVETKQAKAGTNAGPESLKP